MSNRKTEGRLERVVSVLNEHPGGLSKRRLASLAGVPEQSVSALTVEIRRRAVELSHVLTVLHIGGEWIYGWADTLSQHLEERHKRLKSERARLRQSIVLGEQAVNEHPDDFRLRRTLQADKHRLEEISLQLEEFSRALRVLAA